MKIEDIEKTLASWDTILAEPIPPLDDFYALARPSNGNSDILFGRRGRTFCCITCPFIANGRGLYLTPSVIEAQSHLSRHLSAGHTVPITLADIHY